MTSQIQQPRVAEIVREAFDLQGSVPLVVHGDVLPVAIVQNSADAGMPPTARRVVSFGSQAAVVGEYSTFRIEAPPNTLCNIKRFWAWASAATRIRLEFGVDITAPAVPLDRYFTDGRMRKQNQVPACVLARDTYVAATASQLQIPVQTQATSAREDVDWTIGQRGAYDFLAIQCADANQNLIISLEWIETPLP
jgi:hypothetical protein